MSYKPRRAGKKWREGAPDWVVDCFDNPNYADRYTVLIWQPTMKGRVAYLGMSGSPTHPQGVSMWGEGEGYEIAGYRKREGRHRVRWQDLPEHIREHVVARVGEN